LWLARLDPIAADLSSAAGPGGRAWRDIRAVFADILGSDLAVRVWAAVLIGHDRASQISSAGPIARSVLLHHLEVRRKLLALLVGNDAAANDCAEIDRLRRRLEHWSDLAIGHLVYRHGAGECAFDLRRAMEFGEEQSADGGEVPPASAWDVYLVCLRSVFPDVELTGGVYADLREELFHSILACFPDEAFRERRPLGAARAHRPAVTGLSGR
jgi:hypothetical protein